jgi:hypothetical protein
MCEKWIRKGLKEDDVFCVVIEICRTVGAKPDSALFTHFAQPCAKCVKTYVWSPSTLSSYFHNNFETFSRQSSSVNIYAYLRKLILSPWVKNVQCIEKYALLRRLAFLAFTSANYFTTSEKSRFWALLFLTDSVTTEADFFWDIDDLK